MRSIYFFERGMIMGLDNGAYIKSNKRKLTRDMLPNGIVYPFEKDYCGEIEILYWRKCWGLRDSTLRLFNHMSDNDYKFDIDTPEQVMEWIEMIASWIDEEKWENDGESIWSYDEIKPMLIQNIINLSIIYMFMSENPDIYLEFYDSY